MRTDTPHVIRLEDYRPSDFLIDRVELDIRLHPTETRITAALSLRPNPQGNADAPLVLDGDELQLLALNLDGRLPAAGDYAATVARIASTLAANTAAGPIREVHNVRIRETPSGLVVNYHCRVDPDLNVAAVHELVDDLERRVRLGHAEILRVVGHAEPFGTA